MSRKSNVGRSINDLRMTVKNLTAIMTLVEST